MGRMEGRKYLDMRNDRRKVAMLSGATLANFWATVSGNTCEVTGGWWKIDGAGEWWVATTTLTLTGDTAYPYVRKEIASSTVEIGFANTRPVATDGVYHYRVLCKCVASSAGHYRITEQNHPGGDIIQSAPLP